MEGMITLQTKGGWLGKTTVIATPTFVCSISTVRAGLFGPMQMVVCEGAQGFSASKLVGTFVFHPSVSRDRMFLFHDLVAKMTFDDAGNLGMPLWAAAGNLWKQSIEDPSMGVFSLTDHYRAILEREMRED